MQNLQSFYNQIVLLLLLDLLIFYFPGFDWYFIFMVTRVRARTVPLILFAFLGGFLGGTRHPVFMNPLNVLSSPPRLIRLIRIDDGFLQPNCLASSFRLWIQRCLASSFCSSRRHCRAIDLKYGLPISMYSILNVWIRVNTSA